MQLKHIIFFFQTVGVDFFEIRSRGVMHIVTCKKLKAKKKIKIIDSKFCEKRFGGYGIVEGKFCQAQ